MISRNARLLVLLAVFSLLAAPAFAGKSIPVVTTVVEFCTTNGLASGAQANCQTEFGMTDFRYFWSSMPASGTTTPPYAPPLDLLGFSYSVRPDGKGTYSNLDSPVVDYVISEWGTNTAVYSLNTEATAVNGTYDSGSSRGLRLHFFSTVESPWLSSAFPFNRLPPCWNNIRDHTVVVNFSLFASEFITHLGIGDSDMGSGRMNFNMRQELSSTCDQQQARYRMTYQAVCFTRLANQSNGKRVWVATSDVCEGVLPGSTPNYGTALLEAYGGRKRETISYGNWRMPFKLILLEQ